MTYDSSLNVRQRVQVTTTNTLPRKSSVNFVRQFARAYVLLNTPALPAMIMN